MPWSKGTTAATKLKTEVVAYLETLREQFPAKRHIQIYAPGSTAEKRGGTKVEVTTQADETGPHRFTDDEGLRVSEESHRVIVDVKADSKSGGAVVAEAVYGVLKTALMSDEGRAALSALGIYNAMESADAEDFGDTTFERPLALSCSTDVYLTE